MSGRTNATILNVDDDDGVRYARSRILTKEGFRVIEAASGTEALELVKQAPDLVLLDVNLPDMSGFEVCRLIKKNPATALIPVLHVSSTYMDDYSKVMGLEIGADGYLTDPTESTVLIAYIKSLLRIGESEKRLETAVRQWRSTFDAIGHSISILDKEQRVLQCNMAMKRFAGRPFAKIVGRRCWEIVHATLEPIKGCPIDRMQETLERETLISQIGERWFEITVDPVKNEDGDFLATVHIMADITARRHSEERLQKAHKDLESRVKARTAQLRRLSSQLLKAHEEERKLIALELHDSIGQRLTAIKYRLEGSIQELGRENVKVGMESLESIIPIVQESIEEVRTIQRNLRPSIVDDLGIVPTISWFCREFGTTYPGIRVEERIDIHEKDVPDSLKIIIFRIIQEALNNVAKHSRANLVRVSLTRADGKIELTINDNGVGFNVRRVHSRRKFGRSLGLISMKERAELSNGAFSIRSGRGEGTTLKASWQ